MMGNDESCKTCMTGSCNCMHHKMVPLFIVLIGLVFLLGTLGLVSMMFTAITWPVLLILIGLQKMLGGMCKCCGCTCGTMKK